MGFPQVSVSHEVSPLIKLVGRGDTTVVDAYLSPILRRYVANVAEELQGGDAAGREAEASTDTPRLMFMMSSGGLTAAELFQGKDAILSGPAGGVVGMAETGREAGFDRLIGFDMGGTSTDVSHFDGEFERAFETEVAGVRMRAPMMLIHTVAAGGGSILHFDGARFRVGPGLAPAPIPGRNATAAADRSRSPTPTSWSASSSRISSRRFSGRSRTSRSTPRRCATAFAELAQRDRRQDAGEEIADGFIKIAVENMANAIKKISVQRGYDVTRYALNCFGGAGGQHACLVADALGMTKVLIHPFSSLLSAYGMGLADIRATRQQAIEEPLGDARARRRSTAIGGRLGEDAKREVAGQGVPARDIVVHVRAHIRYAGTDTALVVPAFTTRVHQRSRRPFPRRDEIGLRSRAQSALRLHRRDQTAGGRGGVGRGDRRRREVRRAGAWPRRARPLPCAGTHDALLFRRQMARRRGLYPRAACARPQGDGPRHHHGAAPDRRRRGRLARRDHAPRTTWCWSAPCRSRAATPSARRPIPSCSKCSTTCSCRSPSRWACRCRTPPIRSTSRSGSTSPARCSPPTARWSPMRRTCRCISAPWTARSRPSSARTRARSRRATSM